ncbi:ABC transporter permease subunit [Paenibacillus sp. JCM 10914]|uniref:ABC transporter substrate-binding protein/permease n=1 Tax=Paenibacillus sp. JCM 10914 TaxID=1236974 RepID=UPI0003CC5807|nr:ABC transporter substrate-binding protein/permease [Paenibacillus sp. JCM 10914]GAE05404.1 amino acid ABC transporter, amino acid-binding/permease protein [Paenibacillus sp. JCM 10914]
MKRKLTASLTLFMAILLAFGGMVHAEGEKKTVILGTSADYAPYEFHQIIDGVDTIVGFDIEIAKEIAKDLDAELIIQDTSFDALLPELTSGRVDFVISGMNPTEERRNSIDFSDPYYAAEQSVVVRMEDELKYATMESLHGARIGVQKGSIQESIAKQIPNASVVSLDKIPDLLLQLDSERVDAVIAEYPIAKTNMNEATMAITAAKPTAENDEYAIGVRKGNEELLASINATLARLKADDKIQQFVDEASDLAAGRTKENLNVFEFFWKYRDYYVKGIQFTLLISALGVLFGFILGLVIALMRMSGVRILKFLSTAYIEVMRGTPMLVQLFIIHYSLAAFDIKFTPIQSGILTLSLNSAAYLAEIFRAGIQGVDKGQLEAARSLGMTRGQAMRHIILPQALKGVLPAIGNEFVVIIKESSIVSFIGVFDIMYQAQILRGMTFAPLNPLLVAAMIYFIMTFILSKLLGVWERKLSASDNR